MRGRADVTLWVRCRPSVGRGRERYPPRPSPTRGSDHAVRHRAAPRGAGGGRASGTARTVERFLLEQLRRPPHQLLRGPRAADDPLYGDDAALALYLLYELHYRGFAGVDDGWEWEPSLSSYVADRGTLAQLREFAIHRSAYQLKEADPHTWAIPRLTGAVKAAMVEIQADEYGDGIERDMHQTLFGVTMRARRPPLLEVHLVADAHHEQVAANRLAAGRTALLRPVEALGVAAVA